MHCFLQSPYGERSSDSTCCSQIHRQWKRVDAQRERMVVAQCCRHKVSTWWSICKNSPSLSLVYWKLLHIVALFISRQFVQQCQKCLLRTENLCVHLLIVLLTKNQLCKLIDFGDNVYGIQRVWKVDTQASIRPV